jgi:hypothetical protein
MATVSVPLDVAAAIVSTANIPELVVIQGSSFPIIGYAFGVANEAIYFRFVAQNYGSGNLSLLLDWYSRSADTSGSVTWGGAISVITPGDATSIIADTFATETTTSSTVNGTGSGVARATVTISNLDSLAAGDTVTLQVRATTFTSFTGDALLIGVTITYSD